jgi:hypothetical protein
MTRQLVHSLLHTMTRSRLRLFSAALLALLVLSPLFLINPAQVSAASPTPTLTITNATMVEYANSTLFSFQYNYTGLPTDLYGDTIPYPATITTGIYPLIAQCLAENNTVFQLYSMVVGYPNAATPLITYVGGYQTLSNANVLTSYQLNASATTKVYQQQVSDVTVLPNCAVSTAASLATLQDEIIALRGEVANLTSAVAGLSTQVGASNMQSAQLVEQLDALTKQNSIIAGQLSNLTASTTQQDSILAALMKQNTALTSQLTSLSSQLTSTEGTYAALLDAVIAILAVLVLVTIIETIMLLMLRRGKQKGPSQQDAGSGERTS